MDVVADTVEGVAGEFFEDVADAEVDVEVEAA